jgi:hypothetical protein
VSVGAAGGATRPPAAIAPVGAMVSIIGAVVCLLRR